MTERITIGKIVAIHGIKGEVRVLPWTDDLDRFAKLDQIFVSKGAATKVLHICSARSHKKLIILGFSEITNADEAEMLRDYDIEIEKKDLLPLPEDRFYIFDLIGLKVITVQGQDLGVLSDVLQTGSNDVYVVKGNSGQEVLLPALKSVVKQVDLIKREMLVDPLPGLLD